LRNEPLVIGVHFSVFPDPANADPDVPARAVVAADVLNVVGLLLLLSLQALISLDI
jgi:hypothetical protein